MGWGGFFKGLGMVGGALAAPFTGGASLIPTIAGAAGAGLGAIAQGKAQNRGAEFEGQLGLEQLLMQRDRDFFNQQIAREQEGRAGSSDAFRKLLASQRVKSPGPRPQLSKYSIAPRQATEAELTGADALTQEVLKRLQGGNPITPPTMRPMSVDPKLLKPGLFERIAGYASPALGVLSQLPMGRRPSNMGAGGEIYL